MLDFLSWFFSIAVIVGGCLWVYAWMKRNETANKAYFRLLSELPVTASDAKAMDEIYRLGRHYYRNKITGIDDAIQRDIDEALKGQSMEWIND